MILPYLAIALLILVTAYSAVVSFRRAPEAAATSWILPDGARRSARIFVGIATVVIVIGMVAWLSISARNASRRSLRFLIPEGYSGWVRVEFEISGAPALTSEGGQTVVKIPPTGRLMTSSPEQYGWARDSYYFYSSPGLSSSSAGLRLILDSGPERLIWGKINGEAAGSQGIRKYEEFFVGTEQLYKDQANSVKAPDTDKHPARTTP